MAKPKTTEIGTISTYEITYCKKLWMSVINQALMDALSNSKHKRAQINKLKAIKWIINDDVSFENICQMAGLNYQNIRKKIIILLTKDENVRKIIIAVLHNNKNKLLIDETLRTAIYRKHKIKKAVKNLSTSKIRSKHYLCYTDSILKQLLFCL
jgi:hypothetical protein